MFCIKSNIPFYYGFCIELKYFTHTYSTPTNIDNCICFLLLSFVFNEKRNLFSPKVYILIINASKVGNLISSNGILWLFIGDGI